MALLLLPEPRAMRNKVFEGQMLQGSPFKGFKGSLCKLVQDQGKVPRGNVSVTLRPVFVEIIQGVRFSSLLTLMGEFSSLFAMADL